MPEGRPHIPPMETTTAAPPANRHIWGASPFLGRVPGQTYQGRVFVEVWDHNDQVVFCGGDAPMLQARARDALRGPNAPLRGSQVPGTNEAAGGAIPGHTFLGRVIIDVWSGQAVVGITGSHPRVLERARQRLGA